MKRTLCLFVMLILLFPACSHAPGTGDVLPFRDLDVTAVDIRYKNFLSESHIAELTQAEDIRALLKTLRAQQVVSLNASAVEAGGAADSFYFTFHLSDGQLYTAGLCEAPASEPNAASFENDVIRFNVKYESEPFMEFLSSIADWTPTTEENKYPPHYGYTMPGDPPCTAYPYTFGSEQEQNGNK